MSAPLVRKAGLLEDETGLHLLTLSVFLVTAIGPEALAWDFTALRAELEEKWGKVGPVTWQRIQALTVLHAHDMFWRDWEVFENITAAIMGEIPVFSHVQPPEAEEIAIALVTAAKVDTHEYSEEVKDYIVAACLNDGMWYFDGTPLEMCQGQLNEYDRRLGIERRYGDVARALQVQEGFYKDPETAAEVQANKVREVDLVLERYNAEVNRQMEELR